MSINCDVAIVGAGPVGLMEACILHELNPDLRIVVFEKREEATRLHALRIRSDSINTLVRTLLKAPDQESAQEFIQDIKRWRKRSIPTDVIQTKLMERAESKGITILKGEQGWVTSDNFDTFLSETGARVVIGADGAKSQVRNAIGAHLVDVFTLSYLLELKYETPTQYRGRGKREKVRQQVVAEGFDFETVGKPRTNDQGSFCTVSLHKFIKEATHNSLLIPHGDTTLGTQENPWTVKTLGAHASQDPNLQRVHAHFMNYFSEVDYGYSLFKPAIEYVNERIVTFPMRIYRSDCVATEYNNSFVFLVGDASSGMVLERGVNKGFIEAGLCAQAVNQLFKENDEEIPHTTTPSMPDLEEAIPILPEALQKYQNRSEQLFYKESRWARWKFNALRAGELFLKCLTAPFRLLINCFRCFRQSSKDSSLQEV